MEKNKNKKQSRKNIRKAIKAAKAIKLKEQLESLEKHLKWCIDNNKPQEHLDVHIGVISDIKQEIKLKPKEDE